MSTWTKRSSTHLREAGRGWWARKIPTRSNYGGGRIAGRPASRRFAAAASRWAVKSHVHCSEAVFTNGEDMCAHLNHFSSSAERKATGALPQPEDLGSFSVRRVMMRVESFSCSPSMTRMGTWRRRGGEGHACCPQRRSGDDRLQLVL